MNPATGVQTAAGAVRTQEERDVAGLAAQDPRPILKTLVHELRQPLSAIESTAYLLGLGLKNGDAQARERAGQLRALVAQANWILSCGLLLADSSPPVLQPVDMNRLFTDVVASRTPKATRIAFELAGSLPLVQVDSGRMRRLIENLLDFLEGAAASGQAVQVRTWQAGEEPYGVIVEITGSSPAGQPSTSLGCGSSLCLDAARRVVEAHGGKFDCAVDTSGRVRLRMVLR